MEDPNEPLYGYTYTEPVETRRVVSAREAAERARLTYQERVDRQELGRTARRQTPKTKVIAPSLRNAENFDREAERVRRERRRRERIEPGRAMIEVDPRGVRGEQLAPPMRPADEIQARQEGRSAQVLRPYYNEGGRDSDQPDSTSWVSNVDWSGQLVNSIKPIRLRRLLPRRVVDNERSLVCAPLDEDGRMGVGGESAVFLYELERNDPIVESNRSDIVDIEINAQFDGLARSIRPGSRYRLKFDDIHSYLEVANETPVRLPHLNLVLFKEHDSRNLGLTSAVVRGPYFAYTLRKDTKTHKWLLTKAEWRVMRHQLMGLSDSQRFLYWRTRFSVNGVEQEIGRMVVVEQEDPASNPLDPRIYLNLYPDQDDSGGGGGEVALLPNETLSFEFDATTQLESARRDPATGRVISTRWTELPAVGFRLISTTNLINEADSEALGSPIEITQRPEEVQPVDKRQFETSAFGLENRRVLWSLAPSVRRPGGYVLRSISVGPLRKQAAYDALRDAQRAID